MTARTIGDWALKALLVLAIAALAALLVSWLIPRHDPAPARTGAKDTVVARDTGQAIGTATAGRNHDATVNIDLTTKETRDAFDAPAPPPSATPGAPAPPMPAAPTGRLRDNLNEGIVRSNRSADAAPTARGTDAD